MPRACVLRPDYKAHIGMLSQLAWTHGQRMAWCARRAAQSDVSDSMKFSPSLLGAVA